MASTSSGVRWSRKRYMIWRQVQKVSRGSGPLASDSPAMARWKAWLCRFAIAGSSRGTRVSPDVPGSTATIRP